MDKTNEKYNAYIQILKEELIPAMGCTEPIALAYAAAVARKVLGQLPERVDIGASGSIIKNVKSVIVPNTDHLKGIPAAATARAQIAPISTIRLRLCLFLFSLRRRSISDNCCFLSSIIFFTCSRRLLSLSS